MRETISATKTGVFPLNMLALKSAVNLDSPETDDVNAKIAAAINPPKKLMAKHKAKEKIIRTITLSIIMLKRLLL